MTFTSAAVFSLRPGEGARLQKPATRRQPAPEDPFLRVLHQNPDVRGTSRSSRSRPLLDRRLPQSRSTIFDRPKFVTPSPADYDTAKPFERPNNAHAFSSVEKEVSRVTAKTDLPGPGSYETHVRSSLRREGVAKLGLQDLFPKPPAPLPGPGDYDPPFSSLNSKGLAPIGAAPREFRVRDVSPGPLAYFVHHNDSFSKNGSKVHLPRVGRKPGPAAETRDLGPGEYRFTRFIQNQLRLKGAVSFDRHVPRDPLAAKKSLPGPATYEIASSFDSLKPHSFAAVMPRSGLVPGARLQSGAPPPRAVNERAGQHHHSSSAGVKQAGNPAERAGRQQGPAAVYYST